MKNSTYSWIGGVLWGVVVALTIPGLSQLPLIKGAICAGLGIVAINFIAIGQIARKSQERSEENPSPGLSRAI